MHWLHKNLFLISVLVLSLLPFIFWFTSPHLVHTHDGLVHLPRLFEYFDSLKEGNFPVRWAAGINYGYGLPLFNFIYHTPYLVGSLFLALGFGVVNAFKLTILLSFLISGVSMFLFSKRFFKEEKTAFIVTILYQFAPFHLVDVLIRGSFGEVFTYAFLPLALYFLVSYFESKKLKNIIFVAISSSLLIISHNSISLLFFVVCVLFSVFFGANYRQKFVGIIGLVGGLVLSAYYWIPAVLEHKYTLGDVYMQELYAKHFFPLWKILVPNFNDAPLLQVDNISIQVGFFQLIFLLLGVIWIFKTKKKDNKIFKIFIFSTVLVLGSVVFMHEFSKPIWENISQLRQFQFPWRFMTVVAFAFSLYGIFVTKYLQKQVYIWILAVTIILLSFIYWVPKEGYDKIDENYYNNFPLTSTYYGETDVLWTAGEAKAYPKSKIELVEGEGRISNFLKKTREQTFDIKAVTPVTVVSNTVYFPGWRVYRIDLEKNIELPIEFQDPNHRGLIKFSIPQGDAAIRIVFEESKVRLISDVISLFGLLALVVLLLFFRNKKI